MPKITAGELGGRTLFYPSGERYRPTMGKVREALFSILGNDIEDARVLDLYAASGALGLEALSRGARQVVFVEQDPQALKNLERNIKVLGVSDKVLVVKQDVRVYLCQAKFFATHVFCDPPYRSALASETLELLARNPGLQSETLIVLEHASGQEPAIPQELEVVNSREYGDTALSFLRKRKWSDE